MGADGVQIGTRFAVCKESSASEAFKEKCCSLNEGDTMLCLKKLSPTRMIKNGFYQKVAEAEGKGATPDELLSLIGVGRTKRGIFDGDMEDGTLEIGQIASAIRQIQSADEIVKDLMTEFDAAVKKPF